MANVRLPLVEVIEGRTAASTEDSLMVNAYQEQSPDGRVYAVKRGGMTELFAASIIGQGLTYGERLYAIIDNVFLPVGLDAEVLASDNEPYQFIQIAEATGSTGVILKSKYKLYQYVE